MRGARSRWLALALPIVVLAAGCGGGGNGKVTVTVSQPPTSNTTTTTPTAPTKHELAQEYLQIVNSVDEIGRTFGRKVNSWNNKTTNAQAARDAAPVIAAFEKGDNQLLRVDWPHSTDQDVKAMVRANSTIVADLESLRTINLLTVASWERQFLRDASAASAAHNIVRADLGLPPTH